MGIVGLQIEKQKVHAVSSWCLRSDVASQRSLCSWTVLPGPGPSLPSLLTRTPKPPAGVVFFPSFSLASLWAPICQKRNSTAKCHKWNLRLGKMASCSETRHNLSQLPRRLRRPSRRPHRSVKHTLHGSRAGQTASGSGLGPVTSFALFLCHVHPFLVVPLDYWNPIWTYFAWLQKKPEGPESDSPMPTPSTHTQLLSSG